MNTQSLNHYITELLHNDEALKQFLQDPTNSEEEFGITKAERAVLRRTISSLSNKSVNGYSISRDLNSHRRSLRLLQNVLHKNVADHNAGFTQLVDGQNTGSVNPTIFIYITGNPAVPGAPYDNPAIAYTNYLTYNPSGTFTTIGEAMHFNPPPSPTQGQTHSESLGQLSDKGGNSGSVSYEAIFQNSGWFLLSYTLKNFPNNINGTYRLDYEGGTNRSPFWYFSLNGQAISPNSYQGYYMETAGVTQGAGSASFADFPISQSDTKIVWQPIAPDQSYGFGPCFPLPSNVVKLGVSQPQTPTVHPGQVYYTNPVNNITIQNTPSILISSNTDGDGELFTDDVVSISFIDPTTNKVVYEFSHDFSNNCSGVVNKLAAQNIKANLQAYVNQSLNILTKYSDKCGGYTSSLGYYLVFQ